MDKPQLPRLMARVDPVRHFAREGPWFKLAALFIDRLPRIIWTCLTGLAAVVSAQHWW